MIVGASANRMTGRPKLPVFGAPGVVAAVFQWSATNKSPDIVLSNTNLTANAATGTSGRSVRVDVGKTTGAWYFEVVVDAINGTTSPNIGVIASTFNVLGTATAGATADSIAFFSKLGQVRQNNSSIGTPPTTTAGDTVGFGYDFSNGQILVKTASGTNTYTATTSLAGSTIYPAFSATATGDQLTLRTSSSLGLPAGYTYWTP